MYIIRLVWKFLFTFIFRSFLLCTSWYFLTFLSLFHLIFFLVLASCSGLTFFLSANFSLHFYNLVSIIAADYPYWLVPTGWIASFYKLKSWHDVSSTARILLNHNLHNHTSVWVAWSIWHEQKVRTLVGRYQKYKNFLERSRRIHPIVMLSSNFETELESVRRINAKSH